MSEQTNPTFKRGDLVKKLHGSHWRGKVVGEYSTELTPEGYVVESDYQPGSAKIYPLGALRLVLPAEGVK